MKRNRLSPIVYCSFVLWFALSLGAGSLLEQRFPDAAFFSSDSDAPLWVFLGGSVVSMIGGWLFEKWLKPRMSEKGFFWLEIALCLIAIAILLVMPYLLASKFLRIS